MGRWWVRMVVYGGGLWWWLMVYAGWRWLMMVIWWCLIMVKDAQQWYSSWWSGLCCCLDVGFATSTGLVCTLLLENSTRAAEVEPSKLVIHGVMVHFKDGWFKIINYRDSEHQWTPMNTICNWWLWMGVQPSHKPPLTNHLEFYHKLAMYHLKHVDGLSTPLIPWCSRNVAEPRLVMPVSTVTLPICCKEGPLICNSLPAGCWFAKTFWFLVDISSEIFRNLLDYLVYLYKIFSFSGKSYNKYWQEISVNI